MGGAANDGNGGAFGEHIAANPGRQRGGLRGTGSARRDFHAGQLGAGGHIATGRGARALRAACASGDRYRTGALWLYLERRISRAARCAGAKGRRGLYALCHADARCSTQHTAAVFTF